MTTAHFPLRFSLGLLCAALALAAPLAAKTAPSDAARSGIQTAYDGINAAFVQGDLGRFMSYFAPGYTASGKDGRLDRGQAQRQYEDQRRRIKTMHSRYVIQSLSSTPGGTLVEMRMQTDGTGEKRVLFVRLQGTFSNDLWVRDLWADTPQGWRLKHRQVLQDETRTHPG